jgi:O-methyltransferase involved in polyketide biosynthesis
MARNPAAQTAFGPMMLAAMEQSEPPQRRLADDDLAARFLPAPTRWLVTATPPKLMRRRQPDRITGRVVAVRGQGLATRATRHREPESG